MSYVPLERLIKNVDSIYKLTILAGRRAVELNNGAQKLIDSNSLKCTTIAMEEIAQGKVKYKIKNEK